MLKRIGRKKIIRFIALILSLLITGTIAFAFIPKTPDNEIKTARENLAVARNANAAHYATLQFQKANALYDSAMAGWQLENKKLIFFRNYTKVKEFALQSSEISTEAFQLAQNNARKAVKETAVSLDTLEKSVERVKKLYGNLPLSENFRKKFSQAKLFVEEAKVARKKDDFKKAANVMENAVQLISQAEAIGENRMKEYFENFDKWEKLVDQSVKASAQKNSSLIVVDKLAQELMLFKDGRVVRKFPAEFGPNWLGTKNHQGDQATPEGNYLITKKKERRQTRYYKALLINYPNNDDLQRYRNNVKNGDIPKHVDIGGLIEIHGHGDRGFHWTNGCVALADKEMDVVFSNSRVNTPVVIVGSLIPYNEWRTKTLSEETAQIEN